MSSMAFAPVPDIFSRNPGVHLQSARDGSLVVLGSAKSTRLTGSPETLAALATIWSAADAATVSELSQRFGIDRHQSDAAIRVLWQAGALISGAHVEGSPAEKYWLSRDPARQAAPRGCAVITSEPRLARLATGCLQGSGFIVGDITDAGAVLWLDGVVEEMPPAALTMLPVRVRESSAWIGPIHDRSPLGPCFNCFQQVVREEPESGLVPASEQLWRLAIGLAVQRILRLTCADQPDRVKYCTIEVDPARGSHSADVGVQSDCPTCRQQLGLAPDETVTEALAFELGVARGGHERISKPSPRFRPPLGFLDYGDDAVPGNRSITEVRAIARAAAGPSVEDPSRRLTPSGGDLRSNDAFYVLPSTDDEDGVLIGFWSEDPTGLNEKLVRSSAARNLLGGAQALLVTVADRRRLAWKYGSFALKLTLLDAGCITSQAAAMAQDLGWTAEIRDGVYPNEELRHVFGLIHEDEYITSVVKLSHTDRTES